MVYISIIKLQAGSCAFQGKIIPLNCAHMTGYKPRAKGQAKGQAIQSQRPWSLG